MRAKVFVLLLLLLGVAVAASLFQTGGTPSNGGTIDVADGDPGGDPNGDGPDAPPENGGGTREVIEADTPIRENNPGSSAGVQVDHSGTLVVQGRVVSEGDGAPIPEADVELLYPDGDDIEDATTDAKGEFRIEVVEGIPAVVAFRVSAEGYASHAPTRQSVDPSARVLTVEFELSKSFRVEGRVTQVIDGQPVADADIELRCLHALFEDTWEDAETNDDGFYEIEDITGFPREGIDVWVDSSDHSPMIKRNLRVEPGQEVLRVDFQLWEELLITGTVMSSITGQPIEDAEISIASRDPEFIDDGEDELSDEDGTFEVPIDTLPYEDLFVLISAEDHAAVLIDPVPQPTRQGVIALGTIALGQSVTLRGVVRNGRTGAAVQGGDVYIYAATAPDRDDGDYVDTETIDSHGRFEAILEYCPAQGAEIFIDADGHEPTRMTLDIPQNVLQHEVVLDVEPIIMLRGTVRRKANNQPVPGAGVRVLVGAASSDEPFARCRADGSYRVALPAGDTTSYSVVIEAGGQRFPVGNLGRTPGGRNELRGDFTIDLPPRR